MPQLTIFRWRAGRGWLVLAGGLAADIQAVTAIEAALLNRTVSQGPMVYVWAASDVDTAEQHMESMRDLGARTGYLLDILTEGEDDLFSQLSEAGIIVLGDGSQSEVLREALVGVALRGIEEALGRGATVYAVGAAAAILGQYYVRGSELAAGFDWLQRALIMPGYQSEQGDAFRQWMQQLPDSFGLGLGHGAALALGPRGEVEVWGNPAITVLLGQHFAPDAERSVEE